MGSVSGEEMYCTIRSVVGQVLDGPFLVAQLVFLVLLHFTSPYKVYFASFLFEHFVTQSHIIFYGTFDLSFIYQLSCKNQSMAIS